MSLIQKIVAERIPVRIDHPHSAAEGDTLGVRAQIFNLTLEAVGQGDVIGVA